MQQFTLRIPTACHENWEQMIPQQQGKYCAVCSSTVVNFEGMTDGQLVKYFANFEGNKLCGRIEQEQLGRTISTPSFKSNLKRYWQYALAFFLFFTKSKTTFAQGSVRKITATEVKSVEMGNAAIKIPKSKVNLKNIIQVKDGMGSPIPYATVEINETSGMADSLGYFSIKGMAVKDSITISSIGYETKTFNLTEIEQNEIVLQKETVNLEQITLSSTISRKSFSGYAGGMYIVRTSKLSIKDSLKNIIATAIPDMKVFPNPAKRGQGMTVAFSADSRKFYVLRIFSMKGELLLTEQVGQKFNKAVHSIQLPYSWTAGSYVISLCDDKGNKLKTEQFVVM